MTLRPPSIASDPYRQPKQLTDGPSEQDGHLAVQDHRDPLAEIEETRQLLAGWGEPKTDNTPEDRNED